VVDDINWAVLLFQLLDENDDDLVGERRAVLEYGQIHSRFKEMNE
jgi:hypothetical protein